jgi:uncharacterized protein (TIGR02996 family)
MSDEPALRPAILAHPDEDTPRLAYADWLDENAEGLPGHEPREVRDRAAFIRAQIEWERLPPEDRRRAAVQRLASELEQQHGKLWRAEFDAAAPSGIHKPVAGFRRGFIGVASGGPELAAYFPTIAAVCPIQELTFSNRLNRPFDIGPLAACPALASVRRLDFECFVGEVAPVLFPSPQLAGLRFLRLRSCRPEHVELLSTSPAALGLRELWAWGAGTGVIVPGSGLGVLISAEWPALESARIDHCDAGDGGVELLATEFAAHGRRALHVSSTRFTREGVRTAVKAILPGGLDSLSLGYGGDRNSEPRTPPPGTRELRIQGFFNDGDWLVAWIVGMIPPGRFDRLGLVRGQVSAAGARVLASWPGLAHLKELDLAHNWIGDLGAAHLAESPHLDDLESLFVAHNDITKRGKDALKKRFGRRVRVS